MYRRDVMVLSNNNTNIILDATVFCEMWEEGKWGEGEGESKYYKLDLKPVFGSGQENNTWYGEEQN